MALRPVSTRLGPTRERTYTPIAQFPEKQTLRGLDNRSLRCTRTSAGYTSIIKQRGEWINPILPNVAADGTVWFLGGSHRSLTKNLFLPSRSRTGGT
jgi:hypothetical protein